MALSAARVTVAAAAVALNTSGSSGGRLLIVNTDGTAANAVDLGGSDVAAGAGVPLAGGATLTVELPPGEVLYAIRSTSNSVSVAVLRT